MASDKIKARNSAVHGKGVFAAKPIKKGDRLVEYKGKRVPWDDFDEQGDGHTMLFHVTDTHVIDGNQGGSVARYINHSCAPNCEAVMDNGRVFIEAIRDIEVGDELGYDYALQMLEDMRKTDVVQYRCLCGAKKCRGTMLEVPKKLRGKVKRWLKNK